MLDNIGSKLSATLDSLKGRPKLSKKQLEETLSTIRQSLIESDVNVQVVNTFIETISLKFDSIEKSTNPFSVLLELINKELSKALGSNVDRKMHFAKTGPTIIMLVGLQGAGKTTLAGKLALHLKKQGNTPMLVATDLQRANAVEQLKILGEQAGVEVFAPDEGNVSRLGKFLGKGLTPVQVAKDGVKKAVEKHHNFVIIDTAGRLGVDSEMLKEASSIKSAIAPNETLFVIDSMVGQTGVQTAKEFNDGVGISGVVLTKLDSDTKGGVALSITSALNKPILFSSTGEKLEDFEQFHPNRMASRILDLGDLETLVEKAEQVMDEQEADKLASKLKKGQGLNFNDMLTQFEQMEKMGDITSMLKMIPGMGKMSKQLSQIDPNEIKRTKAIIQSMTPKERENPKLLSASRKLRIANGSGLKVSEVNQLLEKTKSMNSLMSGKGLKGMNLPQGIELPPELGSLGQSDNFNNQQKKKKKKKYGNPKKQAMYEKGLID